MTDLEHAAKASASVAHDQRMVAQSPLVTLHKKSEPTRASRDVAEATRRAVAYLKEQGWSVQAAYLDVNESRNVQLGAHLIIEKTDLPKVAGTV